MSKGWILGFLGGAVASAMTGAALATLVPGDPLGGISLGILGSLSLWVGVWVGALGALRPRRYALLLGAWTLTMFLITVGKVLL